MSSPPPPTERTITTLLATHYPPSSSTPTPSAAIKTASQSLSALTSSAYTISPRPNIIWLTLQAIHAFAAQTPRGLDFALHVYAETIKTYPAHVTNEYGSGPSAGKQELRFWLVDFAGAFNSAETAPLTLRGPVGRRAAGDHANLVFSAAEVDGRLDEVLGRVEEWRRERNKFVVDAAVLGRCFAFNFFRQRAGDLAHQVDVALDRRLGWTSADFVGACVLLRACARALVGELEDGEERVRRWKVGFGRFLSNEGNPEESFAVKWHSTLVLRNLRDGPFDETSEQLFDAEHWVF